jgi:hypothetical protein
MGYIFFEPHRGRKNGAAQLKDAIPIRDEGKWNQ